MSLKQYSGLLDEEMFLWCDLGSQFISLENWLQKF